MALFESNTLGTLLTDIVSAILILLIGFVIGKIANMLLYKLIVALSLNNRQKKTKKTNMSFARGLSNLISLCIYIITVIMAIQQLNVFNLVLKIIIILIIILILGTILFSIIDFATNIIFGINILTSKRIEKGDSLKIKKVEGIVEKVGLAHTKLKTQSGDIFIFSNRMFFRNKFSVKKQENK
jgi:small-conductance mechanosensitive channel